MSKRPFEELDSRNNIVIVPTTTRATVVFPAKKPKLDMFADPPREETLELSDIPVPPPPLPRSDSPKPPNIKLLCESDTKTKVVSEKPIESTVSNATLNTPATSMQKAFGCEAKKCETDQSQFPQSRSWASNYLKSIGQIYRKPIKINLSTERNSVSTKELPQKEEINNSVINAVEKNTDVKIKKTEQVVKEQSAKDNVKTSNPTESNSTRYATKISENIPANNNPQNILDVPTLPIEHFLSIRNEKLDPIGKESEQLAAEKYRTLQAPQNPNDVYYNHNISSNFIPNMHIPRNMEHDIDYYRYNAHHNYIENPTLDHYRISHAYKSHYEQSRLANNRSYLDVKIDEFLAKVSRDPPHANRFDEMKTRETYRDNRDDFTKKSCISEERKYKDMNKPGSKDYNISEKYKDITKKSYISSKIFLGNSREDNKSKINKKDDKIREGSKDYSKYHKTTDEESIKDKYKNEESLSKPRRSAFEQQNDLCESKNKTANKRGRRSHSSESSDDDSSRSSEEPKQNKTKRANNRKSSSKDKDKSSSFVSRRSEEHERNKKTIVVDKEKPLKTKNTSCASNRSRGSEEHEYKPKREENEKTSYHKDKRFSYSTRRSEEIEHKSKTKQDKERPPSKDKYNSLRETIKEKIKKAKDEIKRLRRQRENTPDEEKSKYSHKDKPSTSKQAKGRNYESSPEKFMKSIVQVNNNSKLDINEPFDLRSKLTRQNLSQFNDKIREENAKIPEKRENLVITVANDCDETEAVEKCTEKAEKSKKNKNKKVKKIQLVINVVCEESDTSESEDNTASKETKKTKSKEIKKSSSLSAEDLSFLDDLNIDEIVNSLTSTHKDKELDASKIYASNVNRNNEDDHIIVDDESNDSDASTVHLEEVDQLHSLDDNYQLNKKGSEDKGHKNILRSNLMNDNNDVPLSDQRSKGKKDDCTQNLEREKDEALKIKEEISDMTYCTQSNRHIKEMENTSMETTSSAEMDEKAMLKEIFTPMKEIKIEPIEILSDDEILTVEYLGNCKLGDSTLNKMRRGSAKINEILTKENENKVTKTAQNKTEPIKALNKSSSLPVPEVPMTIKSEFAEIDENTTPVNNDATSTSNQIMQSLVEIKEEPKELEQIAEKLTAPLKTNTSDETTKTFISTSNILDGNMQQSEIKIEPVETISHEEVSEINTKENCIEIMQSKKDVSTAADSFKTNACAHSDNTEYSNKTITSNSKITNRNSEQDVNDTVIDKASNNSHIITLKASVKESQKVLNQELDNGITDLKKKTNETIKEDLVKKHLLVTQAKRDYNNVENYSITEQSKENEQTRITTKDASYIASSSKTPELNIKPGLLTPKASSLSPTNAPKSSTAVSTPKSATSANNPQKTNLLSVPKTTGPDKASTTSTVPSSIIAKSTSPTNTLNSATVISTPKSATPANDPQNTNLLSASKSTGSVNVPSTSVISTASNSIPAHNPQKTNLLPVPSPSPANTFKSATVISTPKSVTPANNPHIPSLLPVQKITSKVNTPNIQNSPSANCKASASPKVNCKPSTTSTKPSTSSPVPKSATNETSSKNPEINDADGKPLNQSEKSFLDDTLKPRMQQYLKTSYNITQLIHRGRFSNILKCVDDKGKEMAMKVTREKCKRQTIKGVFKEEMLEELQKDIFEDNLHFVRLHDGFSVGNQWTFLMDYYPKNLKQVLEESDTPFHIDHVQQLSRQLVTAVAVLRNNNIVHSDIKPHHLLLNSTNDRIKLCGFDQAFYGQRKPLPNIGTINYRAPEIILGHSCGFSIDVWSTALVMFEMVTKLQLFPGMYQNDILYKQICTLDYVPMDMLRQSQYVHRHFHGSVFMRRHGEKGQDITYISEHEIFKNNKLNGTIWGVYYTVWGCNASRKQKQCDMAKLSELCQLLQQMLVIHPKHRLPIEFAYASHFLLEVFT